MYIGILVTIRNGFGKKGFYQSQEIGLAKEFHKRGHNVVIYKCIAPNDDVMKAGMEEIQPGITIHYIPVRSVGVHGILSPKHLDPSIDALFCFSDTQLFLPCIIRWCRAHHICFIPYIGIAHSAQRNIKSVFMDIWYMCGTRRYYKTMPVLAKTESVGDELAAQGIFVYAVAPVGMDLSSVNLNFRDTDRQSLREALGYSQDDVIISFIGRTKKEKRPLDMIEIFNHVKDKKNFKLLMIGDGYMRDEVRAKIRAYGLEDKVRVIRSVPNSEIWKMHYISDYFVNLCHREIFGMALMEAVLYESSVVASHSPGPDSILQDMPGHVLCDTDEDIENWLLGPEPSKQDLTISSNKLLDRFSWERCANKTMEIIDAYDTKR